MRGMLMNLADRTDGFFYALERWTRILAILAIAGAVLVIIIPALAKVMSGCQ